MPSRITNSTSLPASVLRRSVAFVSWVTVVCVVGCQVHEPPCHKSIQQLYSDAVIASQMSVKANEICPATMMEHETSVTPDRIIEPELAPSDDRGALKIPVPVKQVPATEAKSLPIIPAPVPPSREAADGSLRGASYSKSVNQKSAVEKAVVEKPAEKKPAEKKAAEKKAAEKKAAETKAAEKESPDLEPTDESVADQEPSDEVTEEEPLRSLPKQAQPLKSSPADLPSGQIRQVSTSSKGTLITEFLEDTDIRQALQAIASQAEVSLIVDEQVTGYVTASIEDASFESALKTLLMPLGLIYRKVSETEYLVGVADPETALFAQMSERINFQPMHIPPTELIALLSDKEQQFARAIDDRNFVLIQAPAEIAESIAAQLRSFDTPIPQVELEAIVCVISPDQGFRSGLDWGHAVTLNGSDIFNVGLQGLAFNGVGSVAGASNVFSDFAVTSAFVQLLAQEGYLAIRAAPRVTARDGDQAQIKITRESFFSTQPQNDSNFFRQEIQQVEAGIELDITPIVRGNNITMKIDKAEVSEDIRTSSINTDITENPFPSINRRTVSTTVHVKDGETIVIGGLVQRQTVDRIAQIPVLGSLPGIGRLFQTIEQTQQDAEVVIFISPKLVKPCL